MLLRRLLVDITCWTWSFLDEPQAGVLLEHLKDLACLMQHHQCAGLEVALDQHLGCFSSLQMYTLLLREILCR